MHLENGAALHEWLTQILPSMCSADPNILSKYIIALICKNKPEEYLRQSCLSQLRIFLTEATDDFVEELFRVVKTKEYVRHSSSDTSRQPDRKKERKTDGSSRKVKRDHAWSDDVETCSSANDGEDLKSKQRPTRERCKDFEEVGFCLLGDCCPYDHGPHPLAVEDIRLKTEKEVPEPPKLNRIESVITTGSSNTMQHPFSAFADDSSAYNPELPQVRNHQTKPDHRNIITLIKNENEKSAGSAERGVGHWTAPRSLGAVKRPRNRSTGRQNGAVTQAKINRQNRTLRVAGIPASLNNISTLHEYFSRFGTVVNVDISFDNNPNTALIAFASAPEASRALSCPDPVLGADGIKVGLCGSLCGKKRSNSLETKQSIPPTHNSFINPEVFRTVHNYPKTLEEKHVDKATSVQYKILEELLGKQRALVARLDAARTVEDKKIVAKALEEVAQVVARHSEFIKSTMPRLKRRMIDDPYDEPYRAPSYRYSKYRYTAQNAASQSCADSSASNGAAMKEESTIAVSQVPEDLIDSVELFLSKLSVKEIRRGRHNELVATFSSRHQAEAIVTHGIRLKNSYLLASWHLPHTSPKRKGSEERSEGAADDLCTSAPAPLSLPSTVNESVPVVDDGATSIGN